MNYAKAEFETAPRTGRFMRELGITDMQHDPEVRYWRRVSAVVGVICMASFIALLVLVGANVPTTPVVPAAPGESVASAAP